MGLATPLSSPSNENIAPQTKGSPFALLGLLMFFAKFISKKLINFIIFEQLKEPAAGGKLFSLRKILAQTSAKISPPPNQKFWQRPSLG